MNRRAATATVFAAVVCALAVSVAGCGESKPKVVERPRETPVVLAPPEPEPPAPKEPPTDFGPWSDMGFGRYMLPKEKFWSDDGAVDIVFHFHAGEAAERDYRKTSLKAIVVSETWGTFSGPYTAAFEDTYRFGRMVGAIVAAAKSITKVPTIHRGRIALVAWSAGYGSIQEILKDARYREWVDTVVLLDGLHTGHLKGDGEGPRPVDGRPISMFTRFAKEAAAGRKTMVITHSSIVPEGYASTTETVQFVANEVGAKRSEERFLPELPESKVPATLEIDMDGGVSPATTPMKQIFRADVGRFHALGYEGTEARDHIRHLRLLDEILTAWVVPAWSTDSAK
ncbi:MAG: hypothetical protein U0169_13160 [Polyangiaceae bacterium]